MKHFAKYILMTSIFALVADTAIVAQTSNHWFEQWYRAKYGRPAPTEHVLPTPAQASGTQPLPSDGFDTWYRAKYGRPSPAQEARSAARTTNEVAIAVKTAGAAPVQAARTIQREKLSENQLTALIASARTPAEHRRIAEFYQAQTQDYRTQAEEHAAMVSSYRASPNVNAKNEAATIGHCKYFAGHFEELAGKSQELAHMHEQMAKEAAEK